jgi:hypothetical protein
MTRKRGWGAGGSSGTSLSAHSGQASDGQFMNHLRSPNCGCCTIIQPHRSSAMANSSAAGLISKVSASTSSARSDGRHLAIVRSCRKVFVPPPWAGGAGSGSLIASSCRLVNAFAGQAVPESASAFSLAWRLRRYRGGTFWRIGGSPLRSYGRALLESRPSRTERRTPLRLSTPSEAGICYWMARNRCACLDNPEMF